ARDRALPVERKGRRHHLSAGGGVLHRLLAARPVDQRVDRARIDRALGAQHLRRLSGERGKLHLPVHMLCEVARQRRLAGAGIAEQPENLRLAGLEPARNRLQRLILLRGELHGGLRQDSVARGKTANQPLVSAQNRSRSTLPPLMMTPMRPPLNFSALLRAPAKPRQPVGSTIIFMRVAKNRMPATSSASVAVRMSSTVFFMMAKVMSPGACVCAPSAIVFGVVIFTIWPARSDCCPSLPASGSTP